MSNRTTASIGTLFQLAYTHAAECLGDGRLLEQFLAQHDEEAFATLVRRHGSMVLGVCRRILGNAADAEDAFQATFLVLVRKAAALTAWTDLGGWLHGVARRSALNARRLLARHRAKEQAMARPETQGEAVRDDWLPLLDEALEQLPEKYRLPIVLCDLEGRTLREVAQRLGWPQGTAAGRLARGRNLLARRLARQGVTLSGGALAVLLGQQASARVPAALAESTVQTATRLAVGGPAALGGIPPRVADLTQGVMQAMFLSKIKTMLATGLLAVLAAVSYAVLAAPDHAHHHAHPGDPVKQEEHSALFDLVSDGQATHVAVTDGAWGDPKTWDKKSVPGAGARVVVPEKLAVTVSGVHDKDRLDWLRVDGTLRFDPKADTALKVVTLVGNVKSTLEIGTEKERVHADKTARLILGDRGEREAQRQRDPYDLSGALLSHGRVRIFGTEYTSHAKPTAVPKKGDTEVHFATAPRGWKLGDKLLFPGLDRQQNGRDVGVDPWTGRQMPVGQHQDEERVISRLSADGKTVSFDKPLAYQHGDIFGYAEAVPVGNLSRNVVIESENSKEVSRRGHIMFMHTQDVVLDAVLFRELGRTNVEGALTSPRLKDGKLVAGTDANPIGRYAVHFHIRWGATYKQTPFIVRNSAIVGSPKLGVVNHGGYGLVDDNVAYRVRGSQFFTENGSEIGRFKGNLAVRSSGTGFDTGDDDGVPIQRGYAYNHPLNIGHGGHGFWLQGGGVDVIDNVAIGHSYSAYGFFVANNRKVTFGGPQEPNNPMTKGTPWERLDVFLAENLKDPGLAHGKPFLHTSAVPFHMARCVGLASRMACAPAASTAPSFWCCTTSRTSSRIAALSGTKRATCSATRPAGAICATLSSSAATRPGKSCPTPASVTATTFRAS